LIVTPQTLLRRHRQPVRRKWTQPSRSRTPSANDRARGLALRLARENPGWGYPLIAGEPLKLGLLVSRALCSDSCSQPSSAGDKTLGAELEGLPPPASRGMLACDFFTVETIALRRSATCCFSSSSKAAHVVASKGRRHRGLLRSTPPVFARIGERDVDYDAGT
jgi:putative transposase